MVDAAEPTILEGTRHAFALGTKRSVELKGIAAPVEVVAIDWG